MAAKHKLRVTHASTSELENGLLKAVSGALTHASVCKDTVIVHVRHYTQKQALV